MFTLGDGHGLCPQLALQLFQTMPEEVGGLVWSPAGSVEPLASILQSLVQVIMGKVMRPFGPG